MSLNYVTSKDASSRAAESVHPSRAQNIDEASACSVQGGTGNADGAILGSSPPTVDLKEKGQVVDGNSLAKSMEIVRLQAKVEQLEKMAATGFAQAGRGVKRGSSPMEDVEFLSNKRIRDASPSRDEDNSNYGTDGGSSTIGEDLHEPPETQTKKTTPKYPTPGLMQSKWSSIGEYAKSESSSSRSSAPETKRGPGRPPKDHAKNTRRITDYWEYKDMSRHEYDDQTIVLDPVDYVIDFGKHKGEHISDVAQTWLLGTLFNDPVRDANPGFEEVCSLELDRRAVIEARVYRAKHMAENESKRRMGVKNKTSGKSFKRGHRH